MNYKNNLIIGITDLVENYRNMQQGVQAIFDTLEKGDTSTDE